ncbi:MauE/DoxX family redox-associated membrane protein [Emticicia sp.]|uniref:DoxX family protein n=1 Tax=Emticicia sp. TaxID=1930953 RepID=UPI003752DFFE
MRKINLTSVILSIILALIYLISGIAKAADINGFGDIIVKYGFPKLYVLAPVITFIEIVLAFALLLFWNTREVALFSFGFIISLSIIFLIGLLFLGIEDCGCLGSFYQIPAWLSLLRNLFMIFASYWLYKNAIEFKSNKFEIAKPIIAFGLGLVTLFVTGFEMKETYYEVSYTQGDKIKNTFLEEYEQSDDTKRLIFIFSPRCGHCKKIAPTLNNLLKQKKYDEIIGLYPKEIRCTQ